MSTSLLAKNLTRQINWLGHLAYEHGLVAKWVKNTHQMLQSVCVCVCVVFKLIDPIPYNWLIHMSIKKHGI